MGLHINHRPWGLCHRASDGKQTPPALLPKVQTVQIWIAWPDEGNPPKLKPQKKANQPLAGFTNVSSRETKVASSKPTETNFNGHSI